MTPPRPAEQRKLRRLQLVYDTVYVLVLLLSSPVVLFMLIFSRRWRNALAKRLGFCRKRESQRPAVWIHGVSVGEVLAAKELVRLIEEEMPWLEVVISTTTRTGQQAARRQYPDKHLFYFPLDLSFATRRVVARVRPSLVLLMELELWPNFLLTTSRSNIPVLLANGRMSTKSARDYKTLQKVIPEPMNRVAHYCVQSEEYAARFRALGVPPDRLTITGSMKFDNVLDALKGAVEDEYRRRLQIDRGCFVLMGGSTHSGEDDILVDTYLAILETDSKARLILCPRHPERLDDVESLIRARGLQLARLSTLPTTGPTTDEDTRRVRGAVILVDTVGELARLYALAELVFVGGSLTRRGGQNMMEPAGLGKAVVVGPNTWNFRDPVELLLNAGGCRGCPTARPSRRNSSRSMPMSRVAASWASARAASASKARAPRDASWRYSPTTSHPGRVVHRLNRNSRHDRSPAVHVRVRLHGAPRQGGRPGE